MILTLVKNICPFIVSFGIFKLFISGFGFLVKVLVPDFLVI